jgi:hypothetical protein
MLFSSTYSFTIGWKLADFREFDHLRYWIWFGNWTMILVYMDCEWIQGRLCRDLDKRVPLFSTASFTMPMFRLPQNCGCSYYSISIYFFRPGWEDLCLLQPTIEHCVVGRRGWSNVTVATLTTENRWTKHCYYSSADCSYGGFPASLSQFSNVPSEFSLPSRTIIDWQRRYVSFTIHSGMMQKVRV